MARRAEERREASEGKEGRKDPLFPDYCRCCVYVPFPSLLPAVPGEGGGMQKYVSREGRKGERGKSQ